MSARFLYVPPESGSLAPSQGCLYHTGTVYPVRKVISDFHSPETSGSDSPYHSSSRILWGDNTVTLASLS